MFVYHQDIHCPRLVNNLMCTMQSWMEVFRINGIPKCLEVDIDEQTHAIMVNVQLKPNQPQIIPLVLKLVNSYFLFSKPRASEYEDELIHNIDITSKYLVW